MSDLTQFYHSTAGKLRYQEFATSGTFTPSAALVSNGGQCWALLVGGGGGASYYAGGGGGGVSIRPATVLTPTSVVIGAGGVSNSSTPTSGGSTVFGALSVTGGASANSYAGGNAGGNGGFGSGYHSTYNTGCQGGSGMYGYGCGGAGVSNGGGGGGAGNSAINSAENSAAYPVNITPRITNSGNGANAVYSGAPINADDGFFRVWWYE